jgi:predicted DsbA family dithiol-disulfide isomerase
MVIVDVVVDVVAPWCYIAKRRLEAALRAVAGRVEAEVHWLPIEMDPRRPSAGVDRRSERAARLGPSRAAALDALVAEAGRIEGLALDFERIATVPNSLDAHRLIALAGRMGVQDAVVEALFLAYFTRGQDLARRDTLLDVAAGAGLDRGQAARILEGDDGTAEVRAQEARARRMGVASVPQFLVNGLPALSWAGDVGMIAAALEEAGAVAVVEAPGGPGRTGCGCDFCRAYCVHTPGRLGADDLLRLCPEGRDVFAWAEEHLRAVTDTDYPKLVPVRRAGGPCHWYRDGRCEVHVVAPFGCAEFDAHMPPAEVQRRSRAATAAIRSDAARDGLHCRVWHHLLDRGLTSPSGDRAGLEEELGLIRLSMREPS